MNPGIVIKKSNISHDHKTAKQFYAWTDKGMICGSTYDIVKRKVERAGAKPYENPPKQEKRAVDPEHEHDVPF